MSSFLLAELALGFQGQQICVWRMSSQGTSGQIPCGPGCPFPPNISASHQLRKLMVWSQQMQTYTEGYLLPAAVEMHRIWQVWSFTAAVATVQISAPCHYQTLSDPQMACAALQMEELSGKWWIDFMVPVCSVMVLICSVMVPICSVMVPICSVMVLICSSESPLSPVCAPAFGGPPSLFILPLQGANSMTLASLDDESPPLQAVIWGKWSCFSSDSLR